MDVKISFLFLIVLMIFTSSENAKICENVLPGLNRLRCGVDISSLDMIPLEGTSPHAGFRKPIVDFTCSKGKKVKIDQVSWHLFFIILHVNFQWFDRSISRALILNFTWQCHTEISSDHRILVRKKKKKKKRFPSESKKLSKKSVSIVNPTPILPRSVFLILGIQSAVK